MKYLVWFLRYKILNNLKNYLLKIRLHENNPNNSSLISGQTVNLILKNLHISKNLENYVACLNVISKEYFSFVQKTMVEISFS